MTITDCSLIMAIPEKTLDDLNLSKPAIKLLKEFADSFEHLAN